ncbi:uncharacterized protein LOC127834868 isoform X2 [Dreissena polymorpha]|uniref:uncharacterized protein LOC127834868 isoform X2 n=1 Tax=Dreissena polymorpha TaxID=45954 RepID=UPI002264E94F|nr:uncharacterized protein LOC127834868 isoform X2 [Dreissena polymorpha]
MASSFIRFIGVLIILQKNTISEMTGVYKISTNADLTDVNVTIIAFNSTTAGNYSCSKNTGTTTITKCVNNSGTDQSPLLQLDNPSVLENNSVTLTCILPSKPTQVSWWRNGSSSGMWT